MMAFDRSSVEQLNEYGVGAPILKGPNTINDVGLLKTSAGVAKFGRNRGRHGFDRVGQRSWDVVGISGRQ